MSRLLKPECHNHVVCVSEESGCGNLILISSGNTAKSRAKRSFISVYDTQHNRYLHFGGARALRTLATEILRVVGDE